MTTPTKNPHAVALGRLGGQAKNPRKGFGSNQAAQTKAQATRKAKRKS